jgi:hypothetical protein
LKEALRPRFLKRKEKLCDHLIKPGLRKDEKKAWKKDEKNVGMKPHWQMSCEYPPSLWHHGIRDRESQPPFPLEKLEQLIDESFNFISRDDLIARLLEDTPSGT